MTFCTAVNCIDGRIQLPVINYLRERFRVEYVDNITAAGPNSILAAQTKTDLIEFLLTRITISLERHESKAIAIAGHYDCAANPASDNKQIEQIYKSMDFLEQEFQEVSIIGLWLDKKWNVTELENSN